MAKRIKDTDYLAISARIRSMETGLLTREKMEQVLDARSNEEAIRLLREWGYDGLDPAHPERMDAALSSAREAMLNDLSDSVPDPRYIDIFRLQYDYHNVKALLKADAVGTDPKRLLIDAGCVKAESLTDAVRRGELGELPPRLAEAIVEAKEILATTRDPQLSDIATDRRYYLALADLASATGSVFLRGYVKAQIDAANLRTLVRTIRMGKSAAFLRGALIEGGEIAAEVLLKISENGGSGLMDVYGTTRFRAAAESAEKVLRSGELTAFEKLCEDAVAEYLSGARFVPFGEAPLISYLAAREAEYANLRILLLGRGAGVPPDVIRARLRLDYL